MEEKIDKLISHVKNDFNLSPGRSVSGLTLKYNKGNPYETPAPKGLKDVLREYECKYENL